MEWQLISEGNLSYFRFQWKNNIAFYSIVSSEDTFLEKFKPIFLKQIHSDVIIDVDGIDQRIGDGLISRRKNCAIGVKIADCLPVYLFSDENICIIHCGWRGVIKGIARVAAQNFGTYKYVLGASIDSCCYEVNEHVADLFRRRYRDAIIVRNQKEFLDLKAAVVEDLGSRDLLASLDYCTKCHPEYFYSYRRGDNEKRNYAVLTSLADAC
jgi:YfiH family protein